jgi:beta-N-acetylhexosaminidase
VAWGVGGVVALIVVVSVVVYAVLPGKSGMPGGSALWRGPAGAPSTSPSVAAASPSPSPSKSAVAGDQACVATTLARLTPTQQAGQVLMVGADITGPSSVNSVVSQYHVGGVFLSGRSSESAAALGQAIGGLQSAAHASGDLPLHVSLDQEGGEVQTLKGTDFPAFPTAVVQGGWSTATLRAHTTDWAARLAHAGVSLDLAPVADTVPAGTAQLNPPIGGYDRQYGSDPSKVATDVATVVSAAQGTGLLTTLKHFPGLGRVRANTDTSTQAVDGTTTADDPYLAPFRAGIQAGSAAVMISSATYPKLDANSIAPFSAPIVTGLLRQKLGFTGLILSDDFGAAAALKPYPVGQRAVRFIQAGGDLALTKNTADIGPMVDALVAAAQGSATFAAQLTEAARQVVSSKVRAGLLTCPAAG